MRRTLLLPIAAATFAVLLTAAACGGKSTPIAGPTDGATATPTGDGTISPGTPTPSVETVTVTVTSTSGGGGSWPAHEDCINYNPNNLTLDPDNGAFVVHDGSKEIIRVYDDQNGTADKALALAKHFKTVCFIGRGNTRDPLDDDYIFEYWKNKSGINSSLLYTEDDCGSYNRSNLTVDDAGDAGWRVKDHDNVLQMFDTKAEANDGKIVLSKYSQICRISSETPDGGPWNISFA
jgi:hypothetical protein